MRVMCVTQLTNEEENVKGAPRPQVGDIDTVANEHKRNGLLYYILDRFGPELGFLSKHFAVLPDTPAEVIEEKELETVTA